MSRSKIGQPTPCIHNSGPYKVPVATSCNIMLPQVRVPEHMMMWSFAISTNTVAHSNSVVCMLQANQHTVTILT